MTTLTINDFISAKSEADLLANIQTNKALYTVPDCRQLVLAIINHQTNDDALKKKLAEIAQTLLFTWREHQENNIKRCYQEDGEDIFCAILRGNNVYLIGSYCTAFYLVEVVDKKNNNLWELLFATKNLSFINIYIATIFAENKTADGWLVDLAFINNPEKLGRLTIEHCIMLIEKILTKKEASKKLELEKLACQLYIHIAKHLLKASPSTQKKIVSLYEIFSRDLKMNNLSLSFAAIATIQQIELLAQIAENQFSLVKDELEKQAQCDRFFPDKSFAIFLALAVLYKFTLQQKTKDRLDAYTEDGYQELVQGLRVYEADAKSPAALGRAIAALEKCQDKFLYAKYKLTCLYQESDRPHLIEKITPIYQTLAKEIITLKKTKRQDQLPIDYEFVCQRVAGHLHGLEEKIEKPAQLDGAAAEAKEPRENPVKTVFTTLEAEKLILDRLIKESRKISNPNKPQTLELADNLYLYGELVEPEDKEKAIAYYTEAEKLGNIKALLKLLKICAVDLKSAEKIKFYQQAIPKLLHNYCGEKVHPLLIEMNDLCQLEPDKEEILAFITQTKNDPRLNIFKTNDSPATAAFKAENTDILLQLTRNGDGEANGYLQMLAHKQNPRAIAALTIYHLEGYLYNTNSNNLGKASQHARTAIEHTKDFEKGINNPALVDTSAKNAAGANPVPNAPHEEKLNSPAKALAASANFPPATAAAAVIVSNTATSNSEVEGSAEPGAEGQPNNLSLATL